MVMRDTQAAKLVPTGLLYTLRAWTPRRRSQRMRPNGFAVSQIGQFNHYRELWGRNQDRRAGVRMLCVC